jgi:hypothetical protein
MDFSMRNFIIGYIGTDTIPGCDRGYCWYLVNGTNYISPAHFEKLKISGVTSNARNQQKKQNSYKQYDAQGLIY